MSRIASFLVGVESGAGLMYLLDPFSGRRRRGELRDKAVHFGKEARLGTGKAMRDLRHRSQGMLAEVRSNIQGGPASDEVVRERVRSAIGRCCSHPHAIEVMVDQGRVTLTGPVLAPELDDIIAAASRVRGVSAVHSRLEVHPQANDVPALQGGGRTPSGFARMSWTPSTRLLATAFGGAMALNGLVRRGILGSALAGSGAVILARAVSNMPLSDMVGLRTGGRRLIDFQKSLDIHAPVEDVFGAFEHFENFPQFMEHVKQVTPERDGLSRWIVAGPAGLSMEWLSELVACDRNERIAWRSTPGSTVGNTGEIRFERIPSGTRIHVRLSYYPPGGALGHLVARLFATDPKRSLDEDLLRLKSLLEEGKTRVRGHRVHMPPASAGRREEGAGEPLIH